MTSDISASFSASKKLLLFLLRVSVVYGLVLLGFAFSCAALRE